MPKVQEAVLFATIMEIAVAGTAPATIYFFSDELGIYRSALAGVLATGGAYAALTAIANMVWASKFHTEATNAMDQMRKQAELGNPREAQRQQEWGNDLQRKASDKKRQAQYRRAIAFALLTAAAIVIKW